MRRFALLGGAIVVVAALPWLITTPYWRGILVLCAMNVLLAMALNLVLGYTGQLNLGQSAFFAIGAYVTTILVKTYQWNFWLAALAAIAAAGVVGLALVVYWLMDNLVRSPVGVTLRAIREDEVSAASLGVKSALWKAFAFSLGAGIAALAGCFYPGFVGTLVPDAFNIIESFTMMAMVIVGGMGTMIGPVIGAVVLTFLPELLRGFGELRLMIYGIALTLVVLFMPGGIVQAWHSSVGKMRRRP